MEIGRRIFYDAITGNVIQDTGERQGSIIETTIDQDIETFVTLSERNRDTFDVIELPFGTYTQDFAESNGYQINVETGELEFSYPDPNAPTAEPVYQEPLTVQITNLKARSDATDEVLMQLLFPPEV